MQYDAWLDVAKHTIIDQLYGGSGISPGLPVSHTLSASS
jgi:hypothetical protein